MEKFSFVYGNMKITIEPVDQFEQKFAAYQKEQPSVNPTSTWYPSSPAEAETVYEGMKSSLGVMGAHNPLKKPY